MPDPPRSRFQISCIISGFAAPSIQGVMTMEDLIRNLGALFLVSLPALWASQDPPDQSLAIDAWIAKLESDRPEERETAMQELRKVGVAAVPFLKRAFAKSGDAETRARLELLLSDLEAPSASAFFDGRRKARENPPAQAEDPEGTREAVDAALRWLARHQNPDGGWSADRFDARCSGTKCAGSGERDYDTGVTGLAILAFLGAGYSQDARDELPDPADKSRVLKPGGVVLSGLKTLLSRQDSEGCVGVRGMKYGYAHAISTLALVEAYGMSRADFLKAPAQKAVDFLVAAQNPGKGWRYSEKCGDNDSSVTGWAVMALLTAKYSSLKVPKAAFEGALAWFDEVTEENGYFQVGYNARSTGKVYIPGKNEQFEHHATMSAIGAAARMFIQKRTSPPVLGPAQLLLADLPQWKENALDFYYWYYGSLALFQVDGPEGPMWKRWNTAVVRALTPNQKKSGPDGCQGGSWDPSAERWGCEGGRVYTTAISALTLETRSRYPVLSAFKEPARR